MIKVYGDRASGNCRKVAYVADYLDIEYDWVDVATSSVARAALRHFSP